MVQIPCRLWSSRSPLLSRLERLDLSILEWIRRALKDWHESSLQSYFSYTAAQNDWKSLRRITLKGRFDSGASHAPLSVGEDPAKVAAQYRHAENVQMAAG